MTSLNKMFGHSPRTAPIADNKWALPTEYIGVEIEAENYNPNGYAMHPAWVDHSDNSLRNGIEWVLGSPLAGTALSEAIDSFFSGAHSYETGPRTSIHIHINATDNISIEQLRSWIALVYVVEPAIFRWADDNRKWCGYCSPLTDMSIKRFVKVLTSDDMLRLSQWIAPHTNNERYYGCNMASIARHGTLEFRYFPCVTEVGPVNDWIQLVMELKKAGTAHEGASSILSTMGGTEEDLDRWLKTNLPISYQNIIQHLDISDAADRVAELSSLVSEAPVLTSEMVRDNGMSPAFVRLMKMKFKLDVTAQEEPNSADEEALRAMIRWYSNIGHGRMTLDHVVNNFMRSESDREQVRRWFSSFNPDLIDNNNVNEEAVREAMHLFAGGSYTTELDGERAVDYDNQDDMEDF